MKRRFWFSTETDRNEARELAVLYTGHPLSSWESGPGTGRRYCLEVGARPSTPAEEYAYLEDAVLTTQAALVAAQNKDYAP